MGCASSKAPEQGIDEIKKDASGAYEAAEKGVSMPMYMGTGSADTSLTREARIAQLEAIYDACDDDKSGGVSMTEYAQLFDRKIDDEMKKMYEMIDGIQHDGVLSKTEFVAFHLEKFDKLNDEAFAIITGRLLTRAEEAVVIDEAPAKAPGGPLPKNM